jgi:hypothetical protein
MIYGLGESHNDDPYVDDYKHLTLEYSQHNGKPINLNTLQSPILGKGKNQLPMNDMLLGSSLPTTASNSTTSSLNSLNGTGSFLSQPQVVQPSLSFFGQHQ